MTLILIVAVIGDVLRRGLPEADPSPLKTVKGEARELVPDPSLSLERVLSRTRLLLKTM